ncbi:MAG: hypothetical protein WC343_08080 [Bacilli bacterium]|jgi:hypothetical protein
MKRLLIFTLVLIGGISIMAQSINGKRLLEVVNVDSVFADTVLIGPLWYNYHYAWVTEVDSLNDTTYLFRDGSYRQDGAWIPIDTMLFANEDSSLVTTSLTGDRMYYLYYRFRVIPDSASSGRVKSILLIQQK